MENVDGSSNYFTSWFQDSYPLVSESNCFSKCALIGLETQIEVRRNGSIHEIQAGAVIAWIPFEIDPLMASMTMS